MMMEAAWILLVIALSSGLAFGVLHYFNREHIWETKQLFVFLTFCFFLLLQSTVVETGWKEKWFPRSRVEPWLADAFSRISHPKLEAALKKASSEEEKSLLLWALVLRGSRRLSPEAMVRRSRIMGKVLKDSNETLCAALFRGNPDPGLLRLALEKLEDKELKEWVELSAMGARAFLNDLPTRGLGQKEMELTLRKVAQVTPSDDFKRVLNGLTQRRVASDSEVCWTARRLHQSVQDLPLPYNQALAVLLTL